MKGDLVRRLRLVGLVEGTSFVLLMGIAMPLKYLADQPLGVKVLGWIHGLLFVVLMVLVAQARAQVGWSVKRGAAVVVAALLPFGPFVIDRRVRGWEEEARRDEGPGGAPQ